MLSLSPKASWMTTTPGNGPTPSGRARWDGPRESAFIVTVSRSAGERVEGDERVAQGAQSADHLGKGVGVEGGVVVGIGPDVHQDDLAGPGRGHHPGDHDGRADVAGGSLPAEGVDGPPDRHKAGPVRDGDGAGVGVPVREPEQWRRILAGHGDDLLRPAGDLML